MTQKITSTTSKGIILGLILILTAAIIYILKIENQSIQWVQNAIMVIGIILFVSQYARQVDYNATFGDYFSHGFKIAALVTIMMIIYLVVFINVFPDYKTRTLELARKQLESKQKMSSEDIDKAMMMTSKFFSLFLIIGALVWNLILGAVGSLIGAAINKRQPVPFQEEHANQIAS